LFEFPQVAEKGDQGLDVELVVFREALGVRVELGVTFTAERNYARV
jgi:hypothetical protein